MKIASLDLTTGLFVEFCKALKGYSPRQFIVKENPLPDDAEVQRIGVAADDGVHPPILRLFLKSDFFAEVEDGEEPPRLPLPVLEAVYER